jgi:outer membrane cobalamin receptor
MKSILKPLFITAIIMHIASFVSAQKANIKGKISDSKTKEGLPSAYILYNGGGIGTDIDGKYTLSLDAGTYDLKFQYVGYSTVTKKVTLTAGEEKIIDVALDEEIKTLGQVVVTGSRYEQKIEEVTMSMEVIRPDLTTDKGATNIQGALNQTPGVQIVDGEPQIRGGSGFNFGAGSRVMILIDGLPVLSGDAGRAQFSFLPLENLEQIEVLKGASSVLYGSSALSGVMNIRTAYPKDKPATKIIFNTGMYNTPQKEYAKSWSTGNNPTFTNLSFFHSRKFGNLDFVFGGNLFSDQGYIGSEPDLIRIKRQGNNLIITGDPSKDVITGLGSDTTYRNLSSGINNYERRARANINLRYRFKKIEGLNAGINANGMIKKEAGSLLVLNVDSGLYRNFQGSQTVSQSNTWYVDPFINYVKTHTKHSLRGRWYHAENANLGNQSNTSDWFLGEYQLSTKIKAIDLDVTTGLMSSYTMSKADLYAGNEDSSGVSDASNNAVYLQLEKRFFDRLTISGGGRIEKYRLNTDEDIQPVFRAGANLKVHKATYLRASWGQGFRFPNIAEKYINTSVGPLNIFPNFNLRPERSWNAEFGVKQGFKIGGFMGFLDLVAFRQEIEDAVEFNFGYFGNNPILQFTDVIKNFGFKSINIKKSRIEGGEVTLAGQGTIGKVKIALLGGYTYISPYNLFPDAIIDSTNGNDISYKFSSSDTSGILKYRFEHMFKQDVQLTYKKVTLGFSYRYLSYMKNIDNIFYWADVNSGSLLTGAIPSGITKYREDKNFAGDYVMDARIIIDLNENMKFSVICDNLLNREYMIRPLLVERPRTFSVQFAWSM